MHLPTRTRRAGTPRSLLPTPYTFATTARETSNSMAHAPLRIQAMRNAGRRLRQRPIPSSDCRDRFPKHASRESIHKIKGPSTRFEAQNAILNHPPQKPPHHIETPCMKTSVPLDSIISVFSKPKGDDNEKPFQAEFFSVERLEQY